MQRMMAACSFRNFALFRWRRCKCLLQVFLKSGGVCVRVLLMNVIPDIHPLDVPGGVCAWMIVVHISNGVLMFV